MKNLLKWAGALALALTLPCAALAQSPIVGKSVAAPAGYLPTIAIYCDDGTGHAALCSFTSGGPGSGTGDASASNQTTQIARETSIRDQIGALSSPATGSTNWLLTDVRTALLGTLTVGTHAVTQSGSWSTTIGGTLPAFAATPTFNVGNGGLGTSSAPMVTIAATPSVGAVGSAAPANAQQEGGRTAAGNLVAACVSANGVWCAPVAGTANSTGTVTAIAASTSTTVCPTATNPVTYEVQIYGTAPVLLGLDGQALNAITPAAGSGAYMLLPTQYSMYPGPVARTNAITAWTATAQTIVCNIITRP